MPETFYRLLIVALCITLSVSAPQNTKNNANITYVKPQPDIENQPTTNTSSRESKIQNIPLTIPNIDKNTNQSEDKSHKNNSNYPDKVNPDIAPVTGNENTKTQSDAKTQENIHNSYPDKLNVDNETNDNVNLPDPTLNQSNKTEIIAAESRQTETIADSPTDDNQTDHLASESRLFDRRNNETTPSYDEAITVDNVLGEITANTEVDDETTKAPNLLPKLSHYGKSTFGSHANNLISGSGKRRFRSRCKCEKIWNCSKLQISVPRCPEEYFLCCS